MAETKSNPTTPIQTQTDSATKEQEDTLQESITEEKPNNSETINPKELSYAKEKEYILRKEKINKIVYEIKYNRDYLQAIALIEESDIGFEEIMNSTVKLTLEDLLILIEKIVTKK